MKRIAFGLYVFLLAIFFHAPVSADSLRCGPNVVCTGDSKFDVIKTCGEPVLREFVGVKTVKQGATWTSINIEQWTYDMGDCEFPKVLIFYGPTLASVDNGKRF